MDIFTILLFFLYSWGFGFTFTRFVKRSDNFWERNIIRVGVGLAVFSVVAVLLNLFGIPLDWRIFLCLSLVFPVYFISKSIKNKKLSIGKENFKLSKENIYILIVLLIFLASLFMYSSGAFNYPYLEDDDPWGYAEAAQYVAVEKNLNDNTNTFKFLDPYPPAYTSLMGVLHQTSTSISWTLKFFNALIISLGLFFFYFASKKFIKDDKKALFATFVLAVLPCFFTHFIWAISLAIPMFFLILYCLEKIDDDKKWMYTSIAVVSGAMLTHPSEIAKVMVLIAVYFIIKCFVKKEFLKNSFYGIAGGLFVSGLWWFSRGINLFLSRPKYSVVYNTTSSKFQNILNYAKSEFFSSTSGSGTTPYSFNDFFIAKTQGLINVSSGWGIIATILLILGIIYIALNYKKIMGSLKQKNDYWIPIAIAWLVITFLNVNSATYGIPGFFSFRTWLLLAVPVALLCSLGLDIAYKIGKKVDIPTAIVLLVVVLGLVFTSGYQKYSLNTAIWPPGSGWVSIDEVSTHSWLKTLPDNTEVFSYGSTPVIGWDKYSCEWCEDEIKIRENLLELSPAELYSFLKPKGYEYLIVSGKAYVKYGNKYGQENASAIINGFLSDIPSDLYSLSYESSGGVILKIL